MPIEWSEDLSTRVNLIDEQHKSLFKAVNELSQAMWDGRGKEEVTKLVTFLANYVVEHFGDEEKLMAPHDYPGYDEHRKQHIKFLQDFAAFKTKFESGQVTSELVVKVLDDTCDWLRGHIRGTDRALGTFLENR